MTVVREYDILIGYLWATCSSPGVGGEASARSQELKVGEEGPLDENPSSVLGIKVHDGNI